MSRRPGDEVHRPRHSLITPTHRVPAILIAAYHLIGTKDDDMGVRHHVQCGRMFRPRQHHQRPGFRYRREGAGDAGQVAVRRHGRDPRSRSAACPRGSSRALDRAPPSPPPAGSGSPDNRPPHGARGKVGDALDRGGDLRRHGDEQIDRSDGDSLERSGTRLRAWSFSRYPPLKSSRD